MPASWVRALNRLIDRLNARFGNDDRPLCPNCIFIRDEAANITEVIDCQTLNHRKP